MKSYFFVFLMFFSSLYSMRRSSCLDKINIRDTDARIGVGKPRQKTPSSPLRNGHMCDEHTPLLNNSTEESDGEIKSYEERFLIDFVKYVVSKGRAKDINALNKYLAIEGNEKFLFTLCFLLKGLRNNLPVLRHPMKVYSDQNRLVNLSINNTHIIRGRYKTNCDVVELNYACSVDSPKSHSRIVLLFLSAILRKIPNKLHGDRRIVEDGCYVKVFIR